MRPIINNGILFGKFNIPHNGHIEFITKASLEVERLYVFVCFDNNRDKKLFAESNNDKYLNIETRKDILENLTSELNNITIISFNEANIPSYPNGWKEWSKRVKFYLDKFEIKHIKKVFTNESSDEEKYKEYFAFIENLKVVTFDVNRMAYNISTTKLRENIFKYWDYLPLYTKNFYAIKVFVDLNYLPKIFKNKDFHDGKVRYYYDYNFPDLYNHYDFIVTENNQKEILSKIKERIGK